MPTSPAEIAPTYDDLLAELSISFQFSRLTLLQLLILYLGLSSPFIVCFPWVSLPTLVSSFISIVYLFTDDSQIQISEYELSLEVQTCLSK